YPSFDARLPLFGSALGRQRLYDWPVELWSAVPYQIRPRSNLFVTRPGKIEVREHEVILALSSLQGARGIWEEDRAPSRKFRIRTVGNDHKDFVLQCPLFCKKTVFARRSEVRWSGYDVRAHAGQNSRHLEKAHLMTCHKPEIAER